MKASLVIAALSLTGCASEHCDTVYHSEHSYQGGHVASGQELIAVTWYESNDAPLAALVGPTGVMSQAVQLPAGFADATQATTGHASAVWMMLDGNRQLIAAVVNDGEVWSSVLAPLVMGDYGDIAVGVAFDGHAYQMFWLDDARLKHEEVSEQGGFGVVDDLGSAEGARALFAVTDGRGQIHVTFAGGSTARVLAFDPATTSTRELSVRSDIAVDEAFWFAGELHLREDVSTDVLHSFDPTTLQWRDRMLPADVNGAGGMRPDLFASPTTLYARSNQVFELDPDLVATKGHATDVDGTLGPDWVDLTTYADTHSTVPAIVQLEQGHSGARDPTWTIVIARASPVVASTTCSQDIPLSSSE